MIGILQGRLTVPWNGELQCFPRGAWEEEFTLAQAAGFGAIEALVETDHNPQNPVWRDDAFGRMREASRKTGIAVRVVCADCFMAVPFVEQPDEALALLERIASRDFDLIVLPFFERAELKGAEQSERLVETLSRSPVAKERLALETTLPAEKLAPLVDRLRTTVCYDLGNTTALGHDIPRDIRILGNRISHVHVKDKRLADGRNVLLGTGDTDFPGAFSALAEVHYAGDYSCETARGSDPFETARAHRAFVEKMLGAIQ